MTKREDVELELNYLAYSRYVSRAHTIFATSFEIILAILLGATGLIVSLVEIEYIKEFNKFYFLTTLFTVSLLSFIVGVIAFYFLYASRIKRAKIIEQIKILQQKV